MSALLKLGTDEETGKEIVGMENTWRDSTPEGLEDLEPKLEEPPAVEPPVVQHKDPVTVATIEEEASKPVEERKKDIPKTINPKAVVYDESGAVKYDGLKPRVDLIPPEVIFAMGEMFRHGAAKYSDRNWEKGMKWSRVFGSTVRHLWAWWGGEDIDPDSKQPHLYSAACCIAMLVAYRERKLGEDDRFHNNKE